MSVSSKLWILLGVVLFVGYLLYSSLNLRKFTCEACVEFQGRTVCRTAAGATREEAVRTAVELACAVLAAGRTESMRCNETPPKSVSWK